MKRSMLIIGALLAVALVPAAAFAAAPDNILVDFGTGELADRFNEIKTLSLALLVPSLLIGMFLEFVRPPGETPRFLAVGIRAFLLAIAISLYPTLAGTVLKSCQGLADKVAPQQASVLAFWQKVIVAQSAAASNPSGLSAPSGSAAAGSSGGAAQYGDSSGSATADGAPPRPTTSCPNGYAWAQTVTGGQVAWTCQPALTDPDGFVANMKRALFEFLLVFLFGILGAARFIVEEVGAMLTAVYYFIGPLALAFAVPSVTKTGGAWFRSFLGYASWPIFTALLMNLLVHSSAAAVFADSGYIRVLGLAVAMALSFASVPSLAAQIVGAGSGGFMSGVVGMGMGAAGGLAQAGGQKALAGAATAVLGPAGGAAAAAAGAAASATASTGGGAAAAGSSLPANTSTAGAPPSL